MSDLEHLTYLIEQEVQTYVPAREVVDKLSGTTIVPIIGPFAVGKTTCIDAVESRHDLFGRSQSFTTRDLLPNEAPDTYRFLPNNKATLEGILKSIRLGELVQVAVHPTTKKIYGSDLRDYTNPYTMLDTLSTSMVDIERTGFGDVKPLALVAPELEWQARFRERSARITKSDLAKRLTEATTSLNWSLDPGQDFPWVVNADNRLNEAARDIVDITLGKKSPDKSNRRVEELLRFVQTLQSTLV